MSLSEYRRKRDFGKTIEPLGIVNHKQEDGIFVIQKHDASHLHYDLRLEKDGVLKSWAVPKEPPIKKGVKRLAIQTEDHPIEYARFEGVIPEGEYGGGTVEAWDKGTYDAVKWSDDEIIINLKGAKLQGRYCLIKFKPRKAKKTQKTFLFFKSS